MEMSLNINLCNHLGACYVDAITERVIRIVYLRSIKNFDIYARYYGTVQMRKY